MPRGGARKGAGRKTKAVEDDLQKLFRKCVSGADREEIVKQWVADTKSQSFTVRSRSRDSLWAYLYGKPVEMVQPEEKPDDALAPPIGDAIERIYGGDGESGQVR